MKAIIYLPITDSHRTPPMGKFLRSVKYDKHIWEGREYDLDSEEAVRQFNADLTPALAYYPGKEPRPRPQLFFEEAIVASPSHLEVPIVPLDEPRSKRKYTRRALVSIP